MRQCCATYFQNPRCGHHKKLDLAMLRDRLGPDDEAMRDDLVRILKCTKCGGKHLALGYEVFVHCLSKDCGHHSRLNLVALAGKLGMDHGCSADDLRPHFY